VPVTDSPATLTVERARQGRNRRTLAWGVRPYNRDDTTGPPAGPLIVEIVGP